MQLVMLGYFGFGNAGDEAVLAAEVAALRAELGEATEFVVIAGDVERVGQVHGLPAVSRTDIPRILHALRASDGLVSGGGSLLQDVTSARPVAFYSAVMLSARILRRPVFVYGQGLGPLRRRTNRLLAGLALRTASYVSLRDSGSIALAASLTRRTVDQVPDPVLGSETEHGEPSDAIAVALRPWSGQELWQPSVIEALKVLSADVGIRMVPFHAAQDVGIAHEVADALGPAASVVDCGSGGYREAVEAIAACRATVGMRLHALVSAAAAERPFVALSYDPKVTEFARAMRQPVSASLPGPVDAMALVADVRRALSAGAPDVDGSRAASRIPAAAIARQLAR